MVYFIVRCNVQKHQVKLLGQAHSLEAAILEVRRHAAEYIVRKNAPVLHRGAQHQKPHQRVHFFTRPNDQRTHQVDVYRQITKRVKGWTGTSYKEREEHVRRFLYVEYALDQAGDHAPQPAPIRPIPHSSGRSRFNTIGGFPANVLQSLEKSHTFQRQRVHANANVLDPCPDVTLPELSEETQSE